jgi:hypothetical protein
MKKFCLLGFIIAFSLTLQGVATSMSDAQSMCPEHYPLACIDGTCCPSTHPYKCLSLGECSTTYKTDCTSRCSDGSDSECLVTKVLGENNPELQQIRDFRDSTLAQSAVGRRVIEIYYNNTGSINAALDRSPALKSVARMVLEAIAPVMGKK